MKIGLFNTFTLLFYSTDDICKNWSVQYIYTHFYSTYDTCQIGLFNTFPLIFIQLMMHVKTGFFKTFILMFYLTHNACKN